jgi:hypothetical protein
VTRSLVLALCAGLAAPPVLACAPVPVDEGVASPCSLVRVHEAHACIDDPSAPGGYRIVSAMDPSLPDCATGVAGRCVQPLPAEERGLLRRALALVTGL